MPSKTFKHVAALTLISLTTWVTSAHALSPVSKPVVDKLPSGVEVSHLTVGKGAKPTAASTVKVHYEGTLINGNVFDSSYRRKETIEFPLNRVIAGWTEGVQLMKEGSKFRFYIPSKLAYGSRGAGRDIGPNEALIFDVELFKVK